MSISFTPGAVGVTNGNSVISRLPTGRQTEILRKFSQNATRLRGSRAPFNFDMAKLGRRDALEAAVLRGIIPILVVQPQPLVTLHAAVQAEPPARGAETITVTPGGTFNRGDAAKDTTFGATGTQDLTAVSSYDSNAVGAARTTIA